MSLTFDRVLFAAYERSLWVFTLDVDPTHNQRGCTPKRACMGLQSSFLFLTLLTFAATATFHVGYVNKQGCLGAQLDQAALFWGGVNVTVNNGGTGSPAAGFFRMDDLFRISIDWDGVTGGMGSIVYDGGDGDGEKKEKTEDQLEVLLGAPWPPGGNPLQSFTPQYIFSFIPALVSLDGYASTGSLPVGAAGKPVTAYSTSTRDPRTSVAATHNFRRFNISLPIKCSSALDPTAGSGFDGLLGYIVSYDTSLVNQLMWSFGGSSVGYVRNLETQEDWSWSNGKSMLTGVMSGNVNGGGAAATSDAISLALLWRLGAVLDLCISFFFLSSISALLVRTLFTSGVAFVYPIVNCVRHTLMRAPATNRDAERALNAAYPWLGGHVRYLRLLGESTVPLMSAHVANVAIMFALHQGAQQTLSLLFYQWKSIPLELPFTLWALFIALEYFSMVYVRTRSTVTVFGKGVALAYGAWGLYFYTVPYGFFTLASTVFTLFTVNLALFCLYVYEIPALKYGKVSFEKPREIFVRLAVPEIAGPAGDGTLPPIWSLWHPLNFVPLTPSATAGPTVYTAPVPSLREVMLLRQQQQQQQGEQGVDGQYQLQQEEGEEAGGGHGHGHAASSTSTTAATTMTTTTTSSSSSSTSANHYLQSSSSAFIDVLGDNNHHRRGLGVTDAAIVDVHVLGAPSARPANGDTTDEPLLRGSLF